MSKCADSYGKKPKQIFDFITSIQKLKSIERFKDQFYWKDYPKLLRYESVAAHTWRLCMLILAIHEHLSKKLDLSKAIELALIHDLPEVIAGDPSSMGEDGLGKGSHSYDKNIAMQQSIVEADAANKLFSVLPEKEKKHLLELWQEFDSLQSYEAKVVKALDRIECMIQVLEYRRGHMFSNHLDFTIKHAMQYKHVDPFIEQFGEYVVSELKSKFKPFEK